MSQQWLTATISCTSETREILSDFLLGLGSAWVSVENSNLIAYFPADANPDELLSEITESIEALRSSGVDLPGELPAIREVSDEGWAERWTEFFKPLKISSRLVVTPPWETYEPDPGEEILLLDPGMGFGTGSHETTRCCLKAIDDLVEDGNTILDVGTGSGILSIAAILLGAERATALDVDPAALQNARHNATLNNVQDRIFFEERSIQATDQGYDIVVANIFAETIVELSTLLKASVKPGRYLVLSGIMNPKSGMVEEAMGDFERLGTMVEGNWTTLTYQKKVSLQ
ncbi:MAG: 50S ribosomal protein L11 methyltransferase [Nitrospirota bacterium]|nr:50S ribosomal protein L11 methyltransferase [Nitrospirota bacterium]